MPKTKKKQLKGKGGSSYKTMPLREYETPKAREVKGDGIGDLAQKAIEKSGLEAHMIASVFPPKRYSFCG